MIAPFFRSIRGIFVLSLFTLNLAVWGLLLFVLIFLRVCLPWEPWRKFWYRRMNSVPFYWTDVNKFLLQFTTPTRLCSNLSDELNPKGWYLVLPNHQSWLDIIILFIVFNRKIPLLKFFMKKELAWIPFVGPCCKALDFPFMGRYSKEYLKKYPEKKGKDIEVTRKACEKFKTIPTSIINFCEGTRLTPEKHARQSSPFKHLLKPKAGGIAFVLAIMGEYLHQILDVNIIYPKSQMSLWKFFCGEVSFIQVNVRLLPIQPELIGNYESDPKFRQSFQKWLNELWQEKDNDITAAKEHSSC